MAIESLTFTVFNITENSFIRLFIFLFCGNGIFNVFYFYENVLHAYLKQLSRSHFQAIFHLKSFLQEFVYVSVMDLMRWGVVDKGIILGGMDWYWFADSIIFKICQNSLRNVILKMLFKLLVHISKRNVAQAWELYFFISVLMCVCVCVYVYVYVCMFVCAITL